MIDISELLSSVEGDGENDFEGTGKYALAIRALCSTARKYNRALEEIENLKNLTNLNKPFPFLRLPREIRNEIYAYSLQAEIAVDTTLHRYLYPDSGTQRDEPCKPPTPGLLRVNKQIHDEAIKMLYSTNIFYFGDSSDMFAFKELIGLDECQRDVYLDENT
jgi:hypothetical protein